MSMYTYAGDFRNPVDEFSVGPNPDGEGFIILVNEYCDCGHECCSRPKTGTRPHTSGQVFEDEDAANDWLCDFEEKIEDDYDQYLEENRHSIARMEMYELWRREY